MNAESVLVGKNAALLSPLHELSSKQEKAVNGLMDEVYGDFMMKVAYGRKMELKKARHV